VNPLTATPLQPGRDPARAWANQELARHEYQAAKPGPIARLADWIGQKLSDLHTGTSAPATLGLVVTALIVVAVCAFLIHRAGGLHRIARRRASEVLPARHTTAAEHRAAADRHAAAAEWDLAVAERFRAIARELEERALLSPQPGRTALEVARDGGAALPEQAAELLVAARYFDEVSYGHLAMTEAADVALRDLDARVRAARPAAVG
jgi:hypothetical protein